LQTRAEPRPSSPRKSRAGKIGPGGGEHDRLVADACDDPHRQLQRMHAADSREEPLRSESALAVRERRAVNAGHHPGDGVPKIGMAALRGVEGLARRQRADAGLRDILGRRQIALADPERHQALTAQSVVEHLDDAACRRASRFRAGGAEKTRLRIEAGLGHERRPCAIGARPAPRSVSA
jgi:hypothetical protein